VTSRGSGPGVLSLTGNGMASNFHKAGPRDYATDDRSVPAIVRWRRKAYRAMQGRARALALIGLLPVAVDRDSFETRAGNAWFTAETGLSDRAVSYAFAELARAGLITASASGPRRRVRLLIPDDGLQAAHDVQPYETCGLRYGSNGSDFFQRKCPACQGGAPGPSLAELG
jgi:hypothetical protein